jgi:DNA-binding NarL/FixJ family response regulator
MIRVIIVDDNEPIRDGLRSLLVRDGGIDVVGIAGDGESALELASSTSPDVVIMDISLPDISGVAVTRQLCTARPDVNVVALSGYSDEPWVRAMLEAGARGYVLKTTVVEELATAVRHVASGRIYLGSRLEVQATR